MNITYLKIVLCSLWFALVALPCWAFSNIDRSTVGNFQIGAGPNISYDADVKMLHTKIVEAFIAPDVKRVGLWFMSHEGNWAAACLVQQQVDGSTQVTLIPLQHAPKQLSTEALTYKWQQKISAFFATNAVPWEKLHSDWTDSRIIFYSKGADGQALIAFSSNGKKALSRKEQRKLDLTFDSKTWYVNTSDGIQFKMGYRKIMYSKNNCLSYSHEMYPRSVSSEQNDKFLEMGTRWFSANQLLLNLYSITTLVSVNDDKMESEPMEEGVLARIFLNPSTYYAGPIAKCGFSPNNRYIFKDSNGVGMEFYTDFDRCGNDILEIKYPVNNQSVLIILSPLGRLKLEQLIWSALDNSVYYFGK